MRPGDHDPDTRATQTAPLGLNPPVWFLIAIAGMVLLHTVAPVYHLARLFGTRVDWIGVVPIVAGIALAAWAGRRFNRHGTTYEPFRPSAALVTDGPYRFTRNPMYLGMVSTLLGIAIGLGSLTPLLVVPVFAGWIEFGFIRPEERLLTDRFGDDYIAYLRRVRRWV